MKPYNIENYDNVIEISSLNEAKVSGALDPRITTGSTDMGHEVYGIFTQTSAGSNLSLGSVVRNGLQMGPGYSVEVVDYGEAITVSVTYNNMKEGTKKGQNFIILFNNKGKCIVKSTSVRWRTCGDAGQAISYIRSRCSNLR